MTISQQAISDLYWWITNLHVPLSAAPMRRHTPDYIVEADASTQGWGAHFNGRTTGGQWSQSETVCHINFPNLRLNILIHLKSDNATSVAYLQHIGGSKSKILNSLSREIWS